MATTATRSATQNAPAEEDALNPKVSASALDLLLIELVPLAQRITEQLHAREQALLEQYRKSRIFSKNDSKGTPTPSAPADAEATSPANAQSRPGTASREGASTPLQARLSANLSASSEGAGSSGIEAGTSSIRDSLTGAETVISSLGFPVMNEETREGVFFRLDGLGYRVGQGLVERFSTGKPRPTTPLDAIKFVCKDLWILVFRKQIDNLKTNHRGIFVLTDNRFQPLSRMSIDRRAGPKAADEALSRAQTYLYFPCGVIRGALAGLGLEATVEATSTEIPTATFQIKSQDAKS